jgi:hypothetical protein
VQALSIRTPLAAVSTSSPSKGSHLNMLWTNVNRTVVRIITPMMVFVTTYRNFVLLAVIKFWETYAGFNNAG